MTTTYIATIPTTEISKRELLFRLRRRSHGKRWQFGIEVGANSGYQHYQCRYETSNGDYEAERRYWGDIQLELQEAGGWCKYELKDGCFHSWMDDELGKFRFGKLKNVQLHILKRGRRQSDRTISCIVDKLGGVIGKTWLARNCWLNGTGIYIDGSGTAADIIADVYDATEEYGISGRGLCIFVDLTRNESKRDSGLWKAIETIKNGYLKDRRYGLREKWIYPPYIYVFTNREPDWERLSTDRWDKMFIKAEGETQVSVWERDDQGEAVTRIFNRSN